MLNWRLSCQNYFLYQSASTTDEVADNGYALAMAYLRLHDRNNAKEVLKELVSRFNGNADYAESVGKWESILNLLEWLDDCVLFLTGLILGSVCALAKNTALLVGIGNYNFAATDGLKYTGTMMFLYLRENWKAKGFSVSHLIDAKATKSNIKNALSKLVASTIGGDVVYSIFSDNGQLVADMNNDEQKEFDQSFVCYDACFSPNYKIAGKDYRGQNHFIDDELFPYLNEIKKRLGRTEMLLSFLTLVIVVVLTEESK